jgi:3-hexulose-6-phosphate synthase
MHHQYSCFVQRENFYSYEGGEPQRMKLQISLDMVTIDEAKKYLAEVDGIVDIGEAGTPLIIRDGLRAVREIKKSFPRLTLLADLKIMDAGEEEAGMVFAAGADIVTVLGAADDATVRGAIKAAKAFGKEVMVDLINVSDIAGRALEVERLGADYICVHTAFDLQSEAKKPLAELKIAGNVVKRAGIGVAGGIKLETLDEIAAEKPDIVIVGGGITQAADKRSAARMIKDKLMKAGKG